MKLKSWAKTSGSKGLQVYVPLNTAVTYDQTKELSHALAEHLEREHPKLVISKMSKALRKGKIFVDWSQNDEHKTTICVYSLRAKEQPTVSTPVTWEEVEDDLEKEERETARLSLRSNSRSGWRKWATSLSRSKRSSKSCRRSGSCRVAQASQTAGHFAAVSDKLAQRVRPLADSKPVLRHDREVRGSAPTPCIRHDMI